MRFRCPHIGSAIYADFDSRINDFVGNTLNGYEPFRYEDTKVIHDPVWGSILLYPWELQILDSPLLQRLRRINQVGLAVLTYPSAHHSRFEHTLGVTNIVSRVVENINRFEPVDSYCKITDRDLYVLRLAALLHDVGHCFYSHLSESVYGKTIEFENLKSSIEDFSDVKEHEIFSYIIINTESFKLFFEKYVDYPEKHKEDINVLFHEIGLMIVGAFSKRKSSLGSIPVKKMYMTQIINGQYDVDKLDYLRRDSYTAGLALSYDIERFLYKIKIAPYESSAGKDLQLHLAMPVSGIATIEEMVFCKLMLFSYIYHHQKVLATEAIIADVIEALMSSDKLVHPCDFLHYTDDDIERMYSDSKDDDFKVRVGDLSISSLSTKKIKDLVRSVKNRTVPKRALVINFDTVDDNTKLSKATVAELSESLRGIIGLREEICNCARDICDKLPHSLGGKQHIDKYDVFIKIPKDSVGADLSSALIFTNEGQFKRLSDIVRLSDWSEAFAYHKWNAYIFARPEVTEFVSIASVIVLKKYGINFKYDMVFNNLKIKEKIHEVREAYMKLHGVDLFA